MTIENQIKEFRNYLVHLGYSKSTIQMLPECVKDFLQYHKTIDIKEITTHQIQEYYEWLQIRPHKKKEGGLSEQYIHHHVYALKVFFNWQEQTHQISYNPISHMRFKSPKANPREPLTQKEIKQLFEATESLKERAMLHLFYSCGLRRSEGEALNIQDIHFKKQMLYVREGKGAKRRAVPLSPKVAKDLELYYLKERTRLMNVKDVHAFMVNKVGLRMQGAGYNKLLKEILSRTSLNSTISLHYLRHSIATHLLEKGLSIEKVRDFLGHGFLETTQIYAKVYPYQLKEL